MGPPRFFPRAFEPAKTVHEGLMRVTRVDARVAFQTALCILHSSFCLSHSAICILQSAMEWVAGRFDKQVTPDAITTSPPCPAPKTAAFSPEAERELGELGLYSKAPGSKLFVVNRAISC